MPHTEVVHIDEPVEEIILKNLAKRPTCPVCNSLRVHKCGQRRGKHRWECIYCGKRWLEGKI